MVDFNKLPRPDDLLILLTAARLGRFTAVAEALETTHTTVSRRILALDKRLGGRTLERNPHGWELTELGRQAVRAAERIEQSLGELAGNLDNGSDSISGLIRVSTPDGFGAVIVAPALVRLQDVNPRLSVELLSATRKVSQNRSGVDLEIVAGHIDISRAQTIPLTDYFLRLYASPAYLKTRGIPESAADLQQHSFVSYVESALQITELGLGSSGLAEPVARFQATSIFAQIEAVKAGCGIGILPSFMVSGQPDLVPVLPAAYERQLKFWAAARQESLRSPAVQAVITAILQETTLRRRALMA